MVASNSNSNFPFSQDNSSKFSPVMLDTFWRTPKRSETIPSSRISQDPSESQLLLFSEPHSFSISFTHFNFSISAPAGIETLEQGTEPPTSPRAPQRWVPTAPSVCALGWVKYKQISLLVILCIIVYVKNKLFFFFFYRVQVRQLGRPWQKLHFVLIDPFCFDFDVCFGLLS